ncbi:MAG TPA: lantibiotic dehydratase [Candidatus Binatia bacterium]|nr:lantibiotic dehydratase [Candidatus Binatia bacterium]
MLQRLEGRAREAERISALLHEAAGETAPPEQAAARGAVLKMRRAIHQDRAVDRRVVEEARPLLTTDLQAQVRQHLVGGSEAEKAQRDFSTIYSEEVSHGRKVLVEALEMPLFRLGLRLAARSLLQRADTLPRLEPSGWDQRGRHTASKLLAYLGRFTTKTSPNGVFCATAVGELTHGPAAVRGENRFERLDFLLHVGEARKIAACLAASPEAIAAVVPRINPTLRREGNGWTLWRPASARRPADDEVRSEVKEHPVMQMFLDAAARAENPTEEIIRTVGERLGRDVRPFYSQLLERGVLIGEVEIPWSERRPLRALAKRCAAVPWARELEEIESSVDSLSHLPLREVPPRMDALAALLESLPHVRPLTSEDLIRCDASTRIHIRLPGTLLHDLERLVPLYARFYGALYPEALFRESFARPFLKRYPADTRIPVLDFYHGLFEPEGLARPAAFLSPTGGPSDSKLRSQAGAAFERARGFFARRASEAAAEGAIEVELSEEDWVEIAGDALEPRFSCAALFQVAAPSTGDLDTARARVCLNAFFPGAGLSVARLAHLHGGIIRELRDGWARQSRPGAAQAEITFMHGGRTANAGLRPPIFPLEIELPGDRATERREAVPLADLTACWDSAENRFVLRWESRGIEILPVINSGINPEGFISFLTMVGGQGLQPLGFFQGFDVAGIRSWPRFTFGNVVLFRRRWVFHTAELPAGKSPEGHFLDTQRWRREHELPLHVFVHSEREPKPFFVDLGSEAFVDLLRRATASPSSGPPGRVHVTEMLPGPDDLWLSDPHGRYASEFLLHLDNLEPVDRIPSRRMGGP